MSRRPLRVGDDLVAWTIMQVDAKEVVEVIVVVGAVDDGDAVYLVVVVEEAAFVAIFLDGIQDMLHLFVGDGALRRTETVRTACLDFDEVKFAILVGDDVQFASVVEVPVVVEYLVSVACEVQRSNLFPKYFSSSILPSLIIVSILGSDSRALKRTTGEMP